MATKAKRSERDGLFQRGKTWYIRTDPVTGRELSLRTTSRREAEAMRAERVKLARDPVNATAAAKTIEDLRVDFLAAFEARVKDGKRSSGTHNFYKVKLGHWRRLMGNRRLITVDASTFDEYIELRRGEGGGDVNISKEVATMVRALKRAKRLRWWGGDLDSLQPDHLEDAYEPVSRVLTTSEVRRVMNQLRPHRAAFVALSVALGTRRSEAFRVQAGDIDLVKGIAHIRGTKTRRSDRWVPIAPAFRALLEEALPYLPLVKWPSLSTGLRRAIDRCRKHGPLEHFTPNDLRRTHSTLLEEMGASNDLVARLLGHTTPALVRSTYGHPAAEALGQRLQTELNTQIAEETRKGLQR